MKTKKPLVSTSETEGENPKKRKRMEHYKKRLIQHHEQPNVPVVTDFIPSTIESSHIHNVYNLGNKTDMNSCNRNQSAKTKHNAKEKGERTSKVAKKRAVCRGQFRHSDLPLIKLGTGKTRSLCKTKESYFTFQNKGYKPQPQHDNRYFENTKEAVLERLPSNTIATSNGSKNLPKQPSPNDVDINKNNIPGRHILPAIIPEAPRRKSIRHSSRSEDDKLSEGRSTPEKETTTHASEKECTTLIAHFPEYDVKHETAINPINLTLRKDNLSKDIQISNRQNGSQLANPTGNITPVPDTRLERLFQKNFEQTLNSHFSKNIYNIKQAHEEAVQVYAHQTSERNYNKNHSTFPTSSQIVDSSQATQMAQTTSKKNCNKNHLTASTQSQILDPTHIAQAVKKSSEGNSNKNDSTVSPSPSQIRNLSYVVQVARQVSDRNSNKSYTAATVPPTESQTLDPKCIIQREKTSGRNSNHIYPPVSISSQIVDPNDIARVEEKNPGKNSSKNFSAIQIQDSNYITQVADKVSERNSARMFETEKRININYPTISVGSNYDSFQRNVVYNYPMGVHKNINSEISSTPTFTGNHVANYAAISPRNNNPNFIHQTSRISSNVNQPLNVSQEINGGFVGFGHRVPNMSLPIISSNSIQTPSNINYSVISQRNNSKDLMSRTSHLPSNTNYLTLNQDIVFHPSVNPIDSSSSKDDNPEILIHSPGIKTNMNRSMSTEHNHQNFGLLGFNEHANRPITSPQTGGQTSNTKVTISLKYPVSHTSNNLGFTTQELDYVSSAPRSPIFRNSSKGKSFPMIRNQISRHAITREDSGVIESKSGIKHNDITEQRCLASNSNYINQIIDMCKSNMEAEFGIPILITLNIWYRELSNFLVVPQEIKFEIDDCKQNIIFFVSSKLFGTNYTPKLKRYVEQMMDICLNKKTDFLIKYMPVIKKHCHDETWLTEFITSLKQSDAEEKSNAPPVIPPKLPQCEKYCTNELKKQLLKNSKESISDIGKRAGKKLNRTSDNFSISKILNNCGHSLTTGDTIQSTSEVLADTQSLPPQILTNNSRLVNITDYNEPTEIRTEQIQNNIVTAGTTREIISTTLSALVDHPKKQSELTSQHISEPERDTGQILPFQPTTNRNGNNPSQDMEDLLHSNFIVNKNKTLLSKKNTNNDTNNCKKQHSEGNIECYPLSDSSNDTSISIVAVDKSMEITRSRSTNILGEEEKKEDKIVKPVENDVIVQKIAIDQGLDVKVKEDSKENQRFWDLYCTDKHYAGEFKEFKETLKATNPEVYNQIVGQMRKKLEESSEVIMIDDDDDQSKGISDSSTASKESRKKKQKTTNKITYDPDIVEIRDLPSPARNVKKSSQYGIEDISDDEIPVKNKRQLQQRPMTLPMSVQHTGTKNLLVRSSSVDSTTTKSIERIVNPELIYGSALLSNNPIDNMPSNLLVRNNVYNPNIQLSPVNSPINNSNVNWSSWMSVEDRQRFFSLSPIIRRQSIETPPGEELIEVAYERENFLISKKRLELIPKGKLFYFAEMNMLIKYKEDKEIKNILDQLQVSGPLILSSKLITTSDVLIIPEAVRFSPTDKLSEPTFYVDEISNVEKHIPKSFYQFYKFVTGYQIVNNNAPVSFQTFLMMHNTDRLKGLFKKYLCALEEGRG